MSKMDGQLLQAEKFFCCQGMYFLCDSFWQASQKDNKLSFYPYKPDSAKDNIYRSVQKKTEKKNGQIK